MAKMTFSSENKKASNFDFPKLYLDHGERARIVCIEPEPEVNFVHTIKAPEIVNGEVVTESVKNKDGSFTERPKMNFIGRHLCFGNMNTLMDKGKDPSNCPTCAAHEDHDFIGEAVRRFAMHVVQYKTQTGKFAVQTPFQAELVVWAFTDQRFGQLTDIAEEHGDLRMKDLLLGPCENKNFQKFDMQVGGSAAWLESEENKKFIQTLYASNKLDDLDPAIGRKVTKEQAQEDIQKAILKQQQAYGGGSTPSAAARPDAGAPSAASLDLEGLLGGGSATPTPEPAAPVSEALDVPEAPVLDLPTAEPAAAVEEPAAPAAEDKPKTLDFDSLLSGLT